MKTVARIFLILFAGVCLTGCRTRLAEQPLTPQQRQWADQLHAWNWKWRLPYHAPYRAEGKMSNDSARPVAVPALPAKELTMPAPTQGGDDSSVQLPPMTDLPPVTADDEVVLVPMDSGAASADSSPAVPTPKTHTVVPGDTLGKIAVRYYGKASFWKQIYDANRTVLDSPDKLKAGTVLTLPPAK